VEFIFNNTIALQAYKKETSQSISGDKCSRHTVISTDSPFNEFNR